MVVSDDVVVEEVAVDDCLHKAREPRNPSNVVILGGIAQNPVENVERTVGTEAKHVMRREGLNGSAGMLLGIVVQDNQLRDDGNSLEVYGERPQNLRGGRSPMRQR